MATLMGGSNARLRSKAKMRPPRNYGPDQDIDEIWGKLARAIKEIQQHHASRLSFEENYRYGYKMVLHNHGDKLYAGVRKLIAEHLDDLARKDIVPTFPRSGVMNSNTTLSTSLKTAGINGSADETMLASGSSGGPNVQSIESALEGERFLKALKAVWDDHISSMDKLSKILKYMDKVYTPSANVPQCHELGKRLFSTNIIHSTISPIQTILISTLLTQIHLERTGEIISRSAMRDVVDIMALLVIQEKGKRGVKSAYEVDFEPVFLRKSEEFYKEEAESSLQAFDASTYLRLVERRIQEEHARCSAYLVAATADLLLPILEHHLLATHLETILNMPGSGLVTMIDDDRIPDLHRLYQLFGRPLVPEGLEVLKLALKKTIQARGVAINASILGPEEANKSAMTDEPAQVEAEAVKAKKPVLSGAAAVAAALRWVQEVVDLKDKFDKILKDAFEENKGVQMSMNEAFQTFINQNPRCQEFISLFIDENLKKGLKGKTDEEVDAVLDKTIVLFRFIIDKDVFERYYKAHLAKRLLNGRSVSEDAERNMVARLKVESGYQFTQKLEGMFNDMRLSTEMMNGYQRAKHNKAEASAIDLNMTVLTSTFWPGEGTATTCVFPSGLIGSMADFERFYHNRHSGRRLTWQSNHGTADIRVAFKARKHELNVSTHCLVILMLFENLDEDEELSLQASPMSPGSLSCAHTDSSFITLQDIKAATQIPDSDLGRSLQSLACGKYRILTKHPKGRDVGPNDSFSFNAGFTCPLAKIKIQTIVGKVENSEERAETQERVDEERKHQIEACIVRIMKARKTLSHNELVSEVVRQLMTRFTPTPAVIKKRIEGLIDREYLERNDMKTYSYLA